MPIYKARIDPKHVIPDLIRDPGKLSLQTPNLIIFREQKKRALGPRFREDDESEAKAQQNSLNVTYFFGRILRLFLSITFMFFFNVYTNNTPESITMFVSTIYELIEKGHSPEEIIALFAHNDDMKPVIQKLEKYITELHDKKYPKETIISIAANNKEFDILYDSIRFFMTVNILYDVVKIVVTIVIIIAILYYIRYYLRQYFSFQSWKEIFDWKKYFQQEIPCDTSFTENQELPKEKPKETKNIPPTNNVPENPLSQEHSIKSDIYSEMLKTIGKQIEHAHNIGLEPLDEKQNIAYRPHAWSNNDIKTMPMSVDEQIKYAKKIGLT